MGIEDIGDAGPPNHDARLAMSREENAEPAGFEMELDALRHAPRGVEHDDDVELASLEPVGRVDDDCRRVHAGDPCLTVDLDADGGALVPVHNADGELRATSGAADGAREASCTVTSRVSSRITTSATVATASRSVGGAVRSGSSRKTIRSQRQRTIASVNQTAPSIHLDAKVGDRRRSCLPRTASSGRRPPIQAAHTGGQAPRDGQPVNRAAGMVVQNRGDRWVDRAVGVAPPARVVDRRERIELSRVADHQGALEDLADIEELVGPHLVRLVDDPRVIGPDVVGDVAPLGRRSRRSRCSRPDRSTLGRDREPVVRAKSVAAATPDQSANLELAGLLAGVTDKVVRLRVRLRNDRHLVLLLGELAAVLTTKVDLPAPGGESTTTAR